MPLSLEEKQAITELTARYNFTIDHHEAEAWADTFVDDGELSVDGKTQCKGRQGRIDFVNKAKSSGYKSRHWVCNMLIEGDGDTARLRMYVMAIAIINGIDPYVMGEYDDALIKVNGQWKFKVRNVSFCAGKSFTDGGLKGVPAIPRQA